MKAQTGMEEVCEYEGVIRRLLPALKGKPELRAEAEEIMRGRWAAGKGNRLANLRRIAAELQEAAAL